MKKSSLRIVSLLVFSILFSFTSFAQNGKRQHDNKNANQRGHKMYQNIPDLTADQETKIEALSVTHQKDRLNSNNQIREKRARLRTLETADKPNMTEINKTIDEISVLNKTMAKNKAKHIQDIRSLLTEKQKVYFDTHHSKRNKSNRKSSCGDHRKNSHKCNH